MNETSNIFYVEKVTDTFRGNERSSVDILSVTPNTQQRLIKSMAECDADKLCSLSQ